MFHPDSYGYRPRKGALDAVGTCRERCWKNDWVVDLDVRKFFDSVPWDLIITAVEAQRPAVGDAVCQAVACRSVRMPDGTLAAARPRNPARVSGQPRAREPVHALAFDMWLAREFPACPFERYADDAVVHCGPAPRPGRAGRDRGRMDRSAAPAPGQDEDRVLPGRKRRGSHGHGLLHVPGVHLPGASMRARSGKVHRVPPGRQQGRHRENERAGAVLAAAQAHRPHFDEIAPRINPVDARLDAVLRSVLPLRAVSPPLPHQRLPGAVDPEEVPAVGDLSRSAGCWKRITTPVSRAVRHWQWRQGPWWKG